MSAPHEHPVTATSVEQVVRQHLSMALGGARGMAEAALPMIGFTVVFLTTHELKLALIIAIAAAAVSPTAAARAAAASTSARPTRSPHPTSSMPAAASPT